MKLWHNFYRPASIEEALCALVDPSASVSVIAGGTDLILDLRQKSHSQIYSLIDVTDIPELRSLELRNESLFIGAAVTISKIAESTLVSAHAHSLVEACRLIGGPQVRNVATLGGNIAHAQPAADGTIALMSLDCVVEVVNRGGRRLIPLEELFLGPGKSALNPGDLLVGFHLPLAKNGQGNAFQRIMRTQGIALPVLNMSVWVERTQELILRTRIACGPSGPVPRRLKSTEESLIGKPYRKDVVERSKSVLLREVKFRTSPHRATETYRKIQAGLLLEETLDCAWNRAGSMIGEIVD